MGYRKIINYDYKPRITVRLQHNRPNRWGFRFWRWMMLPALPVAVAVLAGMASQERPFSGPRLSESLPPHINTEVGLPAADPLEIPELSNAILDPWDGLPAAPGDHARIPPAEDPAEDIAQAEPAETVSDSHWDTVTVKSGDNLSLIFERLRLNRRDLHSILDLGSTTQGLTRLRPGQEIRFRSENGDLLEMVHEQDLTSSLHVRRTDDDGFIAENIVVEPETRVAMAVGRIDSSLFLAGQAAGLSDNLIMQVAEIFGWDVDFVLDIRKGDSFSVIYEELLKDGVKIKDGAILAAEFNNRGKVFRAVRFVNADGNADYYSDEGQSMRKAFLRTPVKFSRISSHFNLQRKHPVLNTIRAHRGVDYAAPTGTPIKATGNGKVSFVGNKGGYGKTVVLQHGSSYSTLYAHMSRFAGGLRQGQSVRQGQVIGYVGMTGLATGPHLHYEFQVNGVHRNPLTVDLPKALPIPNEQIAAFQSQSRVLLSQLDMLSRAHAEAQGTETAAATGQDVRDRKTELAARSES